MNCVVDVGVGVEGRQPVRVGADELEWPEASIVRYYSYKIKIVYKKRRTLHCE